MMRYLCQPGGQHDAVNSGTGLETQSGVNGTSGLTQPAPDSAPFYNTEQSGGGPRSQSMGRGGWLQPQEGSQFVGIPALGLGPGPSHHSLSQETIIIKCPGRFPGPGGPVSSEAPEESLFQGKMCSGPSLASVPAYNAI